jgi:hypothetical protein
LRNSSVTSRSNHFPRFVTSKEFFRLLMLENKISDLVWFVDLSIYNHAGICSFLSVWWTLPSSTSESTLSSSWRRALGTCSPF